MVACNDIKGKAESTWKSQSVVGSRKSFTGLRDGSAAVAEYCACKSEKEKRNKWTIGHRYWDRDQVKPHIETCIDGNRCTFSHCGVTRLCGDTLNRVSTSVTESGFTATARV